MATAPLIGISGRTKTGDQVNVKPEILRELEVDLYFCDYARGVIAAGGLPVFLPSAADPADYIGRLDGLLLSGGADIDPARYGQTPCAELFTPEPAPRRLRARAAGRRGRRPEYRCSASAGAFKR